MLQILKSEVYFDFFAIVLDLWQLLENHLGADWQEAPGHGLLPSV